MKTAENVNPLVNRAGKLLTRDTKKVRILNTYLASVFTSKNDPQGDSLEEGILTLSAARSY